MDSATSSPDDTMATYAYIFKLHPPGLFGLEEPGQIVRPAPPGKSEIEGDVVDTRTMKVVGRGHGTVTRDPTDRIDERSQIGGAACWLHDNFLNIEIPGDNLTPEEGWQRAGTVLRTFVLALSARLGHALRAQLVQAVGDHAEHLPVMTTTKLAGGRIYSLDSLRTDVKEAFAQSGLQEDTRLREALEKLELALTLDEAANDWLSESPKFTVGDVLSALASERFLNYFKAITAILGDPSQECNRWQTFYRDLGLEASAAVLQSLKKTRDDQDVAHVLRSGQPARVDMEQVLQAREMALRVARSYADWLRAKA